MEIVTLIVNSPECELTDFLSSAYPIPELRIPQILTTMVPDQQTPRYAVQEYVTLNLTLFVVSPGGWPELSSGRHCPCKSNMNQHSFGSPDSRSWASLESNQSPFGQSHCFSTRPVGWHCRPDIISAHPSCPPAPAPPALLPHP